MEEEFLDHVVSAIENAFTSAGATNFEDAIAKAKRLIGFFYNAIQPIENREDFKRALVACVPPASGEPEKLLLLMQYLPAVVRYCITHAAEHAAATLPTLPAGRPMAICPSQCPAVLDFIAESNRKGCSLSIAKTRAAQRFNVSRRSIDRLWSQRGNYADGSARAQVTMAEALRYLHTGI